MTREERKRARRIAVISWVVLAIWAVCLLCTCANAATEAATEPDKLTDVLAAIGGCWVAWVITRALVWLDTPREYRSRRMQR